MLLQNIRAKIGARLNGDSEAGFTLIELLVVMLILGILAAIALPAFFNQKSKAGDAKAKENIHTAQVAMETCGVNNNSSYATCTVTALEAIEPTIANDGITVEKHEEKLYKLAAAGSTGHTFTLERTTTGALAYACTPTGEGGCPSGGNWSTE